MNQQQTQRVRRTLLNATLETLEGRRLLAATPVLDASFAGDGRAQFDFDGDNFQAATQVLAVGPHVYAFGGGDTVDYGVPYRAPSGYPYGGLDLQFVPQTSVARLTDAGQLDTTFGGGDGVEPITSFDINGWSDFKTARSGQSVYASRFTVLSESRATFEVARFDASLQRDPSFAPPAITVRLPGSDIDSREDYAVDYDVDSAGNVTVAKFIGGADGDSFLHVASFLRFDTTGTVVRNGQVEAPQIGSALSENAPPVNGRDYEARVNDFGFRTIEALDDGGVILSFEALQRPRSDFRLERAAAFVRLGANYEPTGEGTVGSYQGDLAVSFDTFAANTAGDTLLIQSQDDNESQVIYGSDAGVRSFYQAGTGSSFAPFEGQFFDAAVLDDFAAYLFLDSRFLEDGNIGLVRDRTGGDGIESTLSFVAPEGTSGGTSINLTPFGIGEYAIATSLTVAPDGDVYASGYVLTIARDAGAAAGGGDLITSVDADAAVWRIDLGGDAAEGTFDVDVNGTTQSFDAGDFVSPTRQDAGSVTVGDGTATLVGNSWKHLPLSYNVTADTILEFTATTTGAEIAAFGFDDNLDPQDDRRVFKFGGSDPFAQSYAVNPVADGQSRTYSIRVGDFYTGQMSYLSLVSDDDADANARTTISDVRIFEDAPVADDAFEVDVNGATRTFDAGDFQSPLRQDAGSVDLSAAGDGEVTLVGNAWKHLPFDYNVTADTILTFDARTTGAEIAAFGFDDNLDQQDARRTFKFGGSDAFDLAYPLADQPDGATRSYRVRVGDFYTGQMRYLSFISDDDRDANARTTISNVRVFEDAPVADDAFEITINGVARSYDAGDFQSPTRQDAGTVDLSAAGDGEATLVGNAWKHLPLNYTVTADTVLRFTATTTGAEIAAFGFDDNLDPQDASRVFKFGGSDAFGLAFPLASQPDGATRTYEVRVGDFYTGQMRYLSFVSDDDRDANARTTIRDVRIFEDAPAGPTPYAEVDGVVRIEAAAPTGNGNASAPAQWSEIADPAAVGGRAIVAMPNSGFSSGEATTGDRQDYAVEFASAGTYYVHVRLAGDTRFDNSVHVGLNGVVASRGGFGVGTPVNDGTYQWASTVDGNGRRLTVNVPSAGVHTLNLWVREDGVKVDEIRVAKDASYNPVFAGDGRLEYRFTGASNAGQFSDVLVSRSENGPIYAIGVRGTRDYSSVVVDPDTLDGDPTFSARIRPALQNVERFGVELTEEGQVRSVFSLGGNVGTLGDFKPAAGGGFYGSRFSGGVYSVLKLNDRFTQDLSFTPVQIVDRPDDRYAQFDYDVTPDGGVLVGEFSNDEVPYFFGSESYDFDDVARVSRFDAAGRLVQAVDVREADLPTLPGRYSDGLGQRRDVGFAALAALDDGGFLLAGQAADATAAGGRPNNLTLAPTGSVLRFATNGVLDSSFGDSGVVNTLGDEIIGSFRSFAASADGRFAVYNNRDDAEGDLSYYSATGELLESRGVFPGVSPTGVQGGFSTSFDPVIRDLSITSDGYVALLELGVEIDRTPVSNYLEFRNGTYQFLQGLGVAATAAFGDVYLMPEEPLGFGVGRDGAIYVAGFAEVVSTYNVVAFGAEREFAGSVETFATIEKFEV